MRSTEEVVESLRQALVGAGVVLPSLCVDPVTGASDEPFALVDLGRCNVRVAERLASVVRGERPAVGTHAVDARDGRVGEVVGHAGGDVRLRPVAGGRAWDCPRASVAVAQPEEVLRARLRGTNRESARP
ncbi:MULTISPECIES: hypothetical protein [unclassified Streptomyces]|uniref:hypothetical protein n=1 Tax=unclassified Streptomyces TaxID=2593676 RepID=UPI002442A0EF|nr:hypothetical protein [Streptomyces sp. DH41]MDG9726046.1 hypothetical protein [Streptomyces sp. DH41]